MRPDALVPEQLLDALEISRVGVEHIFRGQVPELVRRDNDPGPPAGVGANEIAHSGLAFGSTVQIDKQPPGAVANMLRCDPIAVFAEHLRQMGRNIEAEVVIVLDLFGL